MVAYQFGGFIMITATYNSTQCSFSSSINVEGYNVHFDLLYQIQLHALSNN